MVSHFTLPHIEISARKQSQQYVGQGAGGGDRDAPVREEHGARVQQRLQAAYDFIASNRLIDESLPAPNGDYFEIELKSGSKVESLEKKTEGIRPEAVTINDEQINVALFVPYDSKDSLISRLNKYTSGALTPAGKPQQKDFVEAIQDLRAATLESFWTDDVNALPQNQEDTIWWEVWCNKDDEAKIDEAALLLELRAADREHRLYFYEATVIPVYASRAKIEKMLFSTCSIIELRRASDSPLFFTEDVYEQQHAWAEDYASRVIWPNSDVPAVCLLDSGVNRAHSLIEPALAVGDCYALKDDWGNDDHHDGHGHGTIMAGMALHGDLTYLLAGQLTHELSHRLESVKIIPPNGFTPNDPRSYGSITQSAISMAGIDNESRIRVFCLSVTNENVSGDHPSTWSAALDQASCGEMIGDEEDAPKRLIIVSAGNIPAEIQRDRILESDFYPVEDPAQAWNAITVGGYTDKVNITEGSLDGWTPFSEAGDLSPFSRTSVSWPHSKSPIKPEIVMEAGNRAISPSGNEVLSVDSLALLGTGKNHSSVPLVSFSATSAAAAQASRMAARLFAMNSDLWPETVRALIIHSAEWTEPMISAFSSTSGVTDNYAVVRRYGYGLPSYDRAAASAKNHLALTVQSDIQPYSVQGGRKFNECHYYSLPWPRKILEDLQNTEIKLKITLSYFIEPSPGLSSSIDPQRYQSHGLRFDLRRKGETIRGFKERVNKFERTGNDGSSRTNDDGKWVLGPRAISAGSLHCDVLTGPAIDLLSRDTLCIYPVGGWWRNRATKDICEKKARYALVITIQTPDTNIDLYTPIKTIIDTSVDIDVQTS